MAVHYYILGKNAVIKNDFETAKSLFKKSVREEDNAPAEYELTRVYMADTTHAMWNIARDHIKNAIKLDPNNIKYRLFCASLALALAKEFRGTELISEKDAKNQYLKVLEMDSTNALALAGFGKVKANEFLEFHNSAQKHTNSTNLLSGIINVTKQIVKNRKLGITRLNQKYDLNKITLTSLNVFAEEDFNLAEKSLIKSVYYDSLTPGPYLTLSTIYEDNNQPQKGIKYLVQLIRIFPDYKDAHLELGLLYYRSYYPDLAYAEFAKAILLMSGSEREDFTYNSAKILVGPFLENDMVNINESELKKIIKLFWFARDPLNLTSYNERLLEHYSRVAYANLRFTTPNYKGWQTDRGITVIRYGIPPFRFRFRGEASMNQYFNKPVTDIWVYEDKIFSFADEFRNGNYQYANVKTQDFAADLLADEKEAYVPIFAGPELNVPYNIRQFKDLTSNNLTDVYVSYGIKSVDKPVSDSKYNYEHKTGLYFFDNYFNKIAYNVKDIESLNTRNRISIPDSGNIIVNSIEIKTKPDTGNISFEILRTADKGVAAYHGSYIVKNFDNISLTLSDILLASNINRSPDEGTIKRRDISILPNPTSIFSKGQDLYIYYEVYNLSLAGKGTTDFRQNIILQKKETKGLLGKIFTPVLKTVGLDNEQKQVSLTSNYQTEDRNSQVYLQLDMSVYDPGNYVLTVKIIDNISGKETEQRTELTWK